MIESNKVKISIKRLRWYLRVLQIYTFYKLKIYIPFEVYVEVNNRCNLKCKYCYTWRRKEKGVIKFGILKRLFSDLDRLGVAYVGITGGEPLLREDLFKIASELNKYNFKIGLNTNGTLISKYKARMLTKMFDYIRISINGLEVTHDKIVGVSGAYSRTIEGLENLNKFKGGRAKIIANVVVSKSNLKELNKLINKIKNKVDGIALLPEVKINMNGERLRYKSVFNNPELIKSWHFLESGSISSNSKFFIQRPSLHEGKKYCDAGKLYAVVRSDSKVFGCFGFRSYLGDLKEGNFYEIWKKRDMRKIEEESKECLGCYSRCHIEVSKIFRSSPLKLLKEFNNIKNTYKI